MELEGAIRIALGIPFILIVPGYVFIFALFPGKPSLHKGIESAERIALSLGISIAVVPLIGLGLNYTPWGIRLEPILISLLAFVAFGSIIAEYRWTSMDAEERYAIELRICWSSLGETPLDKALTMALATSIIAATGALIWAITIPKVGEGFTEFYILGPDGMADGYPTDLTLNESATVILGIQNHEYRNLTYHIELWLVNQTQDHESNTTTYRWGMLLDRLQVDLSHHPVEVDDLWTPHWEEKYTFRIPIDGRNKLVFLLHKEEPPSFLPPLRQHSPDVTQDRVDSAYREVRMWVNVSKHREP
jgi:uncharacterized membrane protein